jgi:hypothetical protein
MPPSLIGLSQAAPLARVSMVLWGEAGCGKTFFAATAPGRVLLINIDPDGYQSLPKDDRILLMDLSNEPNSYVVEQAKTSDPFGIKGILKEHPDISTVVVDSITKFADRATINAIGKAPGSTFENPGPSAYGYRNRYTLQLVSSILVATGTHAKHVIFICHEDVPKTDDKGQVVSITLLLGGSLPQEVPLQISEVWHMRDTGNERRITVRSAGLRKPMKTRMFSTANGIEFAISTKAAPQRVRIDSLIEQWYSKKLEQLPLP